MSASSRPTRRPRSRRPSARLSAVVDLPTPPLPEATAITAATPGISLCRDIGEAGLGGGRCDATGGAPCAGRCGAAATAPGLRSAVNAIMAAVTPGMARTVASACARTFSHARASEASTLIEKNTLPSLTDIADNTLALVKATPRGDITLERQSRTCCCVTLKRISYDFTDATHRALQLKRLHRPDIVRPFGGRRSALLLGGLVVQFDHDAIGVIDEDLPEIATRNLSGVEWHALGRKPLLHAGKIPASESNVMDNAGIGLLWLLGPWKNLQIYQPRAFPKNSNAGEKETLPGGLFQ